MTVQLGTMGVDYDAALKRLKRMDDYASSLRLGPKMTPGVSWQWGQGTTGYDDIRVEVEKRVAELLPGLITEVVEAARRDADQKLRALTGLAARLDTQLNGERQP